MLIESESAMHQYGQDFAKQLTLPAVIELIGDVGVGKTTFTQGLADGLGIKEPITSPSFTLSKRYGFMPDNSVVKNATPCELVHYDFYRLDDPGIMRDELAETMLQPDTVTVIEWGGEVADLLPKARHRITIRLNQAGAREVTHEALS